MNKLILSIALFAFALQAEDTITTAHGTFRGQIVKETDDGITIRVVLNNHKAEIKVDTKSIVKVERNVPAEKPPAPPAEFFETPKAETVVKAKAKVETEKEREARLVGESVSKAAKKADHDWYRSQQSISLGNASHLQQDILKKDPTNKEAKETLAAISKQIEELNETIRKEKEAENPHKSDEEIDREVIGKLEF